MTTMTMTITRANERGKPRDDDHGRERTSTSSSSSSSSHRGTRLLLTCEEDEDIRSREKRRSMSRHVMFGDPVEGREAGKQASRQGVEGGGEERQKAKEQMPSSEILKLRNQASSWKGAHDNSALPDDRILLRCRAERCLAF
ncbi:hypothetical protein AXG93_93s1440 [Marchantia polymorpha subsp. ruderalis]|uniref:Uncharacterized protein n=1 Tax=Marchantia polymorpha subsp. ruderalis TaxID=1480154 RepID=A0A176WU16_MARPO|nr:hypothetical protein AXG93_93s1440 [Marchantia polymorpha subsp. ruderalis]